MESPPSGPAAAPRPASPATRDVITDAIRYWELRRIPYNLVLLAVTLVAGPPRPNLPDLAVLVILAMGANNSYCAAYVPDVFIQLSHFREPWRRFRWVLWLIGTTCAAIIALPLALTLSGVSLLPSQN